MRLLDVNEKERGALLVLLIECFEVAGPATERRSGETAEDEHLRTPRLIGAAGDGCPPAKRAEGKVRRMLTDAWSYASHSSLRLFPILRMLPHGRAVHAGDGVRRRIDGVTPGQNRNERERAKEVQSPEFHALR
jgi:hypothetical protein